MRSRIRLWLVVLFVWKTLKETFSGSDASTASNASILRPFTALFVLCLRAHFVRKSSHAEGYTNRFNNFGAKVVVSIFSLSKNCDGQF